MTGAHCRTLRSGAAVQHLDDWVLSMHGARRSRAVIEERRRTVIRLGDDLGVQPCQAQPLQIAEWMAGYNDVWSDNTACTYYGQLKAWFLWLQLADHRVDNPMLKVGRPRTPDREPRPVSDAGLVKLLCTPMHHRTRVMILLAALAGLRVSEIAAVRGEHVDVSVPSIWVEGKNLKGRTLPLHPLLVEVAETMPKWGIWFPANATRPGQQILGKSVSHIISLVMRRAQVAGTPHKLRHWYGTTLLSDGADLRVVQELMRHSSLATTQIYTKIPDQRRHDAVRKLDPFRAGDIATLHFPSRRPRPATTSNEVH